MVTRILGSAVVLAALRGQARAPFLERHRIEAVRDARIRRIVAYAARTVPYYRELFERERIDARDIRTARDLDALPSLDREQVRRHPRLLLSESRRARRAIPLLTSGSTGTPLEIFHDRRSVLANIAYGERERAAVVALCGGSFRPREAYIGYGTSNFRRVLEFYERHTLLPRPRRTSLSMTDPVERVAAGINAMRPDIITGYGGYLDVFFRTLEARGLAIHRPRVVMYVGERLPAERRAWIERELGARVMSRYCAVEAFKVGYFCEESTGFHVHEDLCHVRVIGPDGRDAGAGQPGQIVISNLINHGTVLLNYPMGDVAALSEGPCPCGRQHIRLSEIHGRLEDVLPLPDGQHLHPRAIWAAFKDDREVLRYQLVQQELQRFELRLATADEPSFARARERALGRLLPLLGREATIHVIPAQDLGDRERELTGKFRAVESRVRTAAAT